MDIILKFLFFPILLIASCLTAGVYGAVHDQISYAVSPDYFHHFKFHQFRISPEFHDRIGAAIVGWRASWWMGIIIGVPVLLTGMIVPGPRLYFWRSLLAIGVVVATTLLVGLGGLAYASWTISDATLPDFWYPDGVVDQVAFARVGMMHGFSYLGGGIGIVTGSIYLVAHGIRLRIAAAKAARK